MGLVHEWLKGGNGWMGERGKWMDGRKISSSGFWVCGEGWTIGAEGIMV